MNNPIDSQSTSDNIVDNFDTHFDDLMGRLDGEGSFQAQQDLIGLVQASLRKSDCHRTVIIHMVDRITTLSDEITDFLGPDTDGVGMPLSTSLLKIIHTEYLKTASNVQLTNGILAMADTTESGLIGDDDNEINTMIGKNRDQLPGTQIERRLS